MKKSMWSKIGSMSLAGSILLASCTSFTEEPTIVEQSVIQEQASSLESSVDLNARKSAKRNYFERFSNQIISLDEFGNQTKEIPAYFPGFGEGNSTHMGKAYSFLNQYASFGPKGLGTVGAPVSQFFSKELAAMGLTKLPEEVSSLTTDGKGNSVWFKNIENNVTPTSDTRMDFQADVEIIGGTGKFKNASGTAVVEGYFNPLSGEGMSTIQGRIDF
ncbi:hypothetical protein FHS59_003958 [Algoriphagus iocasae]|jgi:hypothetical protein|uniref:Uncharacterized protein n=1 Tax=Algoriphagus iocasae TaxID=1836499 RepID=A0A841N0V6_9BACT|nr:hypothetical protein [Algoriphagus iocasae]MBB6328315.1 hypothetical protein [Algoriphagus iocasae]